MYHGFDFRSKKRNRDRVLHNNVDQISELPLKRNKRFRIKQEEKNQFSVVQTEVEEERKQQEIHTPEKENQKINKKQQKAIKEEKKKRKYQEKLRKKEEKRRRQEERWRRWGHTRKPNFLVLALYAVFDWFADFGPMLRALKQGVGKGARHSWRFIVDGIIYLLNISQIIGIIYVSIGHSYSLLLYGGAMGTPAFVMVYIFESVFVFCSVLIDISIKRGIRNPWAWAGFLIGFIFVEVSNVFAMSRNLVGTSVGVVLPILLIVMKKVMEWWYRKPKKKERQKESFSWFRKLHFWKQNDEASSSHTPENFSQNTLTRYNKNESHTQEEVLTQSKTAQEKEKSSHTTRTEESLTPSLTEEKFSQEGLTHEAQNDEEFSSQKNESHSSVRTKAHTEVKTISQKGDSSHTHKGEAHTSEKNSHTQVSQQNDSLTQNTQGNDSHTQENKSQSKSHTTRKKSRTRSQKKSHTNSSQQKDMDEIKKVAMRMADENGGKYPSIRKLSAEAKCSEWHARLALNDLKKAN